MATSYQLTSYSMQLTLHHLSDKNHQLMILPLCVFIVPVLYIKTLKLSYHYNSHYTYADFLTIAKHY